MTEQAKNRILVAIKECDAFIGKEGARDAKLRPLDMQQHLDFCIAHRAKLLTMMEAA